MKKLLAFISLILLLAAGCGLQTSEQAQQQPTQQKASSTPSQENPLGKIPFTNITNQWQSYASEIFPLSFDVPAGAMVTTQNSGTSQQFIEILGPIVKDTYWPWITIEYYSDAPFYNPPAGSNISNWILHNKDYSVSYDSRGKDTIIAGLQAIHLTNNPSMQAPGSEDFYVISKRKLYKILFLNSAGKTSDWTLYNKFLASIKFQ
jgi:hypothetical protein